MSNGSGPIWTREEPGSRRPRFTREQIAQTALRLADAEGIEAVSMRRIAAELGAGTMTLYHYVRSKDELFDLLDDTLMGEILVSREQLAGSWREALAAIARASRAVFARHPWAMEGLRGARGGPNGMRHFEQTLVAVRDLPLDVKGKLELVSIVDDYVFGWVVRTAEHDRDDVDELREHIVPYFGALLATGEYPELERLFGGKDLADAFQEVWDTFRSDERFERGLQRLLDGIEASLDAW
jgi:AcrR family transcriptional regulator